MSVVSGDCFGGTGKYAFNDGTTYEGRWRKHKMHGLGVLRFVNGDALTGTFTKGKISADHDVVFTHSAGGRYTGKLVDGKMDGGGELACTFFDESKFIGGCTTKGLNGRAKLSYFNNDVADAEWKDGVKHGNGRHQFSNGDAYVGAYQNGQKHGKGRYVYQDGAVYDGDFKDGEMDGHCEFTLADGTKYTGVYSLASYADGYRNAAADTWTFTVNGKSVSERADGSEGDATAPTVDFSELGGFDVGSDGAASDGDGAGSGAELSSDDEIPI